LSTPISELCKDLPKEFCTLVEYARNLRFEAKPDYTYLQGLMEDLLERSGYKYDWKFDWDVDDEEKIEVKKTSNNLGITEGIISDKKKKAN